MSPANSFSCFLLTYVHNYAENYKAQGSQKIKGEGMPLHLHSKKGDLYVTFEVLFPTSRTEEQKTKIKAVLG